MKSSWTYMKGVRKYFVYFCIFLGVQLALGLYFPELLRGITRTITIKANENDSYIWDLVLNGVAVFCVIIFILVFTTLAEYCSNVAIDHYGKNVRRHIFEKLQKIPTESVNQLGSATLLPMMMNDTNWMKNWQKRVVLTIFYLAINLLGGFLMLFFINPSYALISLCSLPFVIAFFFIGSRKLDKTINTSIAMFDAVYHNTKEGIIGAKEIRILNKSEERAAEFDKYIKLHRKQDLHTKILLNTSISFHAILFTIITAGIIIYGALNDAANVELLSDINAAIMYVQMIWAGSHFVLQNMADYIPRIKYTKRRINSLLELEEDINEKGIKTEPAPRDNLLEFENVSYLYRNNARGVENVSLVVERNNRVALVGGVGSGKNLIPQMLLKTIHPESGKVLLSGMEISAINTNYFRKNIISMCSQDPDFMPGTIRDNMKMLNPDATDEQIIETFYDLGLDWLIVKFGGEQNMLNYVMSERTSFNDTTKNLLSIVRSLLKPASIYIFDQCFDHIKQEYIIKLCAKLKKEKRTCLFVTHKLWICKQVNKVYVMSKGKITGSGSHDKLSKSNKEYKELFALGSGEQFMSEDDVSQAIVQEAQPTEEDV